MTNKPCVVIPVYNHHEQLAVTLEALKQLQLPVIVVDDGNELDAKDALHLIADSYSATLLSHACNLGKGAAVKTGLVEARQMGFTHALQIDADGQHATADIPLFLAAMAESPNALIAGYPQFDKSVPLFRYYARYATHIWVWINTLSTTIRDSMCGFRLYPLNAACELFRSENIGNRMDFDCEFIVRWYWRGLAIKQLQTKVIYPESGNSNFKLLRDNALISWMHTKLFFGMLLRIPSLLRLRKVNRE